MWDLVLVLKGKIGETDARKKQHPNHRILRAKNTHHLPRFQNTTLGIKEKRNSPPGSSERASRDCRALAV